MLIGQGLIIGIVGLVMSVVMWNAFPESPIVGQLISAVCLVASINTFIISYLIWKET